ncbi:IDEAL domain-containing protein [Bacillaceae bacterium ZC4]|jgi:uncharacterized protein YpiB (UPF0302 family)|uniref:IDEAL domain-containing protein n=2 Tax=Aeribacillus TaxID=1055323 RepID=A0A165Z2J7_9BACI|nr:MULTISPECIES: IDEAL domain-containing protein [Aeribacillus]AXI39324.1 IDEAL domain-containing protein [Bacillaceae bacterium ZC4]REJ25671.1 MAG: IDEAL domain-containing protein [Bacillaceae bacterium]ASS90468.1 hypothetical protein AP3564_09790 [Aeribacillus pallidus]KZM54135.1 hypothetical protein A3Q35_15535 [Aeribacillus pallidus]KZN97752.1 hypothetical protein AZI98_02035 [Aeribacillus pallidus]
MENRKSYSELMKTRSVKENPENFMMDVYIQMILDEAWFNHRKKMLEDKINDALDRKDREKFMELSKEYAKWVR